MGDLTRVQALLALVAAAAAVLLLTVPTAASDEDGIKQAPWLEPVTQQGIPDKDEGLHARVLLETGGTSIPSGARDLVTTETVNIGEALRKAGYPHTQDGRLKGFQMDLDSIALVEVDREDHEPINIDADGHARLTPAAAFPGGFDKGISFDPGDPVITLRWLLEDETDTDRAYFLYLDPEHTGDRTSPYLPEDTIPLATATGPGTGTRLYVPLQHDDEPIVQTRHVEITNQAKDPVDVDLYLYTRHGMPAATPDETITLEEPGDKHLYTYPSDHRQGGLMITATGPVSAHAVDTGSGGFTRDDIGTSTQFLPAQTSGFIGDQFVDTPQSSGIEWFIYCPSLYLSGDQPCEGILQGGMGFQSLEIPQDGFQQVSVQPHQPFQVTMDTGQVAVQRIHMPGGEPPESANEHGITVWPPLDGPGTASQFMGYQLEDDTLALFADGDAQIDVKLLEGFRDVLAQGLGVDKGLFSEGAWGVNWDRDWEGTGFDHDPHYEEGVVGIWESTDNGLAVASGKRSSPSGFNVLAPLQSPDGGLTYAFEVPERTSSGGETVRQGSLVGFALYGGTSVDARAQDGSTASFSLAQHERFQVDEAGLWAVEADRPVVVTWVETTGQEPATGLASGLQDIGETTTEDAQYAGYLFDVRTSVPFQSASPGSIVEFPITVENLAANVEGDGLEQGIKLDVDAPPGWTDVDVRPGVITDMAPFEEASATVEAFVPENADQGATLRLTAQSQDEPGLEIDTPLRVNLRVDRSVQVTADGQSVQTEQRLQPDETAIFEVLVVNTGTAEDTFEVGFSPPPSNWEAIVQACFTPEGEEVPCHDDVHETTPSLDAGESVRYLVQARPQAISPGQLDLRAQATSINDPSARDSVRALASITQNRAFTATVEGPVRVIEPGNTTTFPIMITNEAEASEEIRANPQPSLPEHWPETTLRAELPGSEAPVDLKHLNHVIPIDGFETVPLLVNITVPKDAPPHEMGALQLDLESTLDEAMDGRQITLHTFADRVLGFKGTLTTEDPLLEPGKPTTLEISLSSTGNDNQTIQVDAHPSYEGNWTLTGPDDDPLPHNLTMSPSENKTLPLTLTPPETIPPTQQKPSWVNVTLASERDQAEQVAIPIVVPSIAEARIEAPPLHVVPGQHATKTFKLHNTGNTPLDVTLSWIGLPTDWASQAPPAHLDVGESVESTHHVTLPPHASLGPLEATLEIRDADGALVTTRPFTWNVGAPDLELVLVSIDPASTTLKAVQADIANHGTTAAHDVRVKILEGDATVDQIPISQILPDAEHRASLTVPSDATDLRLEATASHLEDPITMDLSEEDQPSNVPLPGLIPIIATTLGAAGLAPRRRPI